MEHKLIKMIVIIQTDIKQEAARQICACVECDVFINTALSPSLRGQNYHADGVWYKVQTVAKQHGNPEVCNIKFVYSILKNVILKYSTTV